jgi:polysaccharide export outer membrane protein
MIFLFTVFLVLVRPDYSALLAQEVRPAQEIPLRKGDMVKLEVPQREDLNRLLTIDSEGDVSLPIIGTVHIEGLTVEQAKGTLLRSLQELYPSTQSIELTLVGEKTRRSIFVQGEVWQPGKFDFEGLLTIWDAIKEAGGARTSASLEAVRLIRTEGGLSTTTMVNVQQALDSGNLESLPAVKPGDTIIVPDRTAAFTGMGAVNVIGAVLRPDSYFLSENKRLADAILAAGGSTENANLRKVRILRVLPEGRAVKMEVNFKRYLETGDISDNPVILPNDAISIPRSSSWSTITSPSFVLGLISASASLIALWITLTR